MIDAETYRQGIETLNRELEREKNELIRSLNTLKKEVEAAKQDLYIKWQTAKIDIDLIACEFEKATKLRCFCGKKGLNAPHVDCKLADLIKKARSNG